MNFMRVMILKDDQLLDFARKGRDIALFGGGGLWDYHAKGPLREIASCIMIQWHTRHRNLHMIC